MTISQSKFEAKSMTNSLSISNLASLPNNSATSKANEQFLRFHLEPNTTILLPIQQMTEVLTIKIGQIVPIFQMAPWVMGVYNWRGEILWMVDLGHLLGLTPWHQQSNITSVHTGVVLQVRDNQANSTKPKNLMLGLIVNRVEDIEWCNPDEIQSPPSSAVTPELVRFLRGYWLKSNGEMLVVLDGEAIINAMPS